MSVISSIRLTAISLAAVSCVTFWVLQQRQTSLAAEFQALRSAHPPPIVLNGLRFSLDGTEPMALPDVSAAAAGESARRTVLLVLSDICPACVRALQSLRELLASLGLDSADEVVVASYNGTALAVELSGVVKAVGARFRALTIVERHRFQLATGISSTPTIVVLDAERRLRFVSHVLDASTIAMLQRMFHEEGPIARRDVSPGARPQLVIDYR